MSKIGLFLSAEPHGGGTFQYDLAMLDAVACLAGAGFDPVVYYAQPLWKRYVDAYDVRSVHCPISRFDALSARAWRGLRLPIRIWRALCPPLLGVARRLMRERCDLWIFPSQDPWTYQIPVPAVGVIHDLMHRYERQFPEVGTESIYRRREFHYRSMCEWAAGLFVESPTGKNQAVEAYSVPPDRVHVLPMVPPRYLGATGVPAGFDTRYRLPAKYLFYPAQFWEHKNHKRLIRALEVCRASCPDMELVLAGSQKNGYASARDLVHELGLGAVVHFLGYVPDEDMPEIYRRARALVMPTFFGPSNLPPLEAFSLGCPVAISGIHGMDEQYGESAICFDPGSVEKLAEAMGRLWRDDALCTSLSRRGLEHAARWEQADFNRRVRDIVDRLCGQVGVSGTG